MSVNIVPLEMNAYPGGTASAKEAVMHEIAAGNAEQNHINKTLGGRRSRTRRIKKMNKNKSKKLSHKKKREIRRKRSSRRRSSKRISRKRLHKIFYGGLEGGDVVAVPTFPGSSTGPLSANTMSANLNLALLTSGQGAKYDSEINK